MMIALCCVFISLNRHSHTHTQRTHSNPYTHDPPHTHGDSRTCRSNVVKRSNNLKPSPFSWLKLCFAFILRTHLFCLSLWQCYLLRIFRFSFIQCRRAPPTQCKCQFIPFVSGLVQTVAIFTFYTLAKGIFYFVTIRVRHRRYLRI